MKKHLFFSGMLALFMLIGAGPLKGISLPSIFSDHIVLQQQQAVTIWGWGKPYEKVTVFGSWDDVAIETAVDNQAHWSLQVQTPKAGGPYTLTIRGYNEIILKDVLIGEVWVCSGQSNMEWSARLGIDSAGVEVSRADYPLIRFFSVNHRTALTPQIDLSGQWTVCSPQTMIDFSAVAYFFARKLQAEMDVPIGLINSSWGGTPAEVWTPEDVFEEKPALSEAAGLISPMGWSPKEPGRVFNAMLAPLVRFRIAGAIWYQGETNTANPATYKDLMAAMIGSWREAWGYEFPFYYAQIAPYKYGTPFTGAEVRDAQRRALEIPNTGMVMTSDIGNIDDIHPRNKQEVGLRMANLALTGHYQVLDQVVSGPLYRSFNLEKKSIRVFFDHAEGLVCRGGPCTHFEIAGEDGVFHPAEAVVEDNTVVVSSPEVRTPKAVRFGWSNTAEPNLFNGAGLPASCFK